MEGLLPVRPRPYDGELFTSWLMRLAHANVQRLPFFTRMLTGDANFWVHDADRHLRPDVVEQLAAATGVTPEGVEALSLRAFEGRLFPGFQPRSLPRWVLPLYKKGYLRERPGLVYCPHCLREKLYLRLHWRLSFMTACPEHGCELLDACPRCQAPYAPQRNDLGFGQDWSVQPEPPFGYCAVCEADLRDAITRPAAPPLVTLQARLLGALRCGVMPWSPGHEVPAIEGFDVLHQLLAVVVQGDMEVYLTRTCGHEALQAPPERRNRTFEDHALPDRRRLMQRVADLIEDWPHRLIRACETARVYKRPLMVNFAAAPAWYVAVADQVSRANGRRPYKRTPLAPHLSLEELRVELQAAPTARERRRWEILCHYHGVEEALPVAQALGSSRELVFRTVSVYNESGPDALRHHQRGRPNPRKRLLTAEQEADLHAEMQRVPMTYEEMADWVECRVGKRPCASTMWIYRRGVENHSREGRRAQQ